MTLRSAINLKVERDFWNANIVVALPLTVVVDALIVAHKICSNDDNDNATNDVDQFQGHRHLTLAIRFLHAKYVGTVTENNALAIKHTHTHTPGAIE